MQTLRRFFVSIAVVVSSLLMQSWAQPGFRTAPAYTTGPNAYSIAVEDYNGDGIDDMAVVNYNGGNAGIVSVLLGNSDGTFKTAVNYTVGRGPRFIAAGDFNNDGKWDLVTANQIDSDVSVLIGNGDGTFQAAQSYSAGAGSSPWNVQVANFVNSNPTVEDLVVADNSGNNVDILIGNGNGTFQVPVAYSTGFRSGPLFTRVADYNNDGKLDLAVASFSATGGAVVFLGNGDGTFQLPAAYYDISGAIDSDSIFAADFNGNGHLDLAVTNELSGNLTVFSGNGDGTFQTNTAVNYPTGAHPRSVVSYDFNKDGTLDLLTGNDGSNDVTFLQGLGGGTFAGPVSYGAGYEPRYVAIDDFNKDGNEDLAVANFGSGNVTVLLGFGDGTFNSSLATESGNHPESVVVADFNLDGIPDQAVVNSADNTIAVAFGNGDGTFKTATPYNTGNSPVYAAAADVNGDGYPDLIVANQSSGNVTVLLNAGASDPGTFSNSSTHGAGSSPTAVATGDFNGDGFLDLAVSSSQGVGILLNNGSGGFSTVTNFGAGSNPQSVAVGDFNGDGILDLVVANKGSKNVSVLLGQGSAGKGNGTFGAALPSPAGTSPYSVAVGDFNLDGKLDVAVANSGSNNVSVLLGNGDGTLKTAVNYSVGSTSTATPEFVAVADYNGDGKLDLAVANEGEADVSVLYGNGDGTFQLPSVNFTVGINPMSIGVGDMNNDGALDLEVANFNSNTVTALLNIAGTIMKTTGLPNPSVVGQPVTFTTTIAAGLRNGGTPTGTIQFKDGSNPIGSAQNIVNGTVSLTYSGLTAGTHTINAAYSGDTTFNPHTVPYTQVVGASGPAVTLSPTSLTFATTLIGTSSQTQNITVTNTGNQTLTISQIAVTGTDLAEFKLQPDTTCGSTLGAGSSCVIGIAFRPTATGTQTATLSITDNATNSPQTAPLSGVGTVVKLNPTSLNFGSVKVGRASPPKAITVTNVGGQAITFTGTTIGGTDPSDFTIQKQGSTCAKTLNGGKSCILSIVFTPQATGQRTGTVVLTDNGGGSPQQVALTGTGK